MRDTLTPTPTPADVALIERLNRFRYGGWKGRFKVYVNPDGPEAATRLAALAAEVERVRDIADELEQNYLGAKAAKEAAEARLAALLQPDEAMVDAGSRELWRYLDLNGHREEGVKRAARACLTAALKEGASGCPFCTGQSSYTGDEADSFCERHLRQFRATGAA